MSRVGRAVPIATSVPEALRLFAELMETLSAEAGAEAAARVDAAGYAEAVRRGELPGALWVGPKDEAVGIAWWEPPSEIGRRVGVFLVPEFRREASFAAFLTALETLPGGPIVEVSDEIPGLPPVVRARVLSSRGFVPVSRLDLTWPPDRSVPSVREVRDGVVRVLGEGDAGPLARLLERAYADNPVDLALFRQRRDPDEDAEEAIRTILFGGIGPWISSASFGVEVEGRLMAATLVNDYHGVLISEVMVDPAHRRKGWARALLVRTLARLREMARADIRLVVTLTNTPAYRLYTELGFAPLPSTQGSTWLNAAVLGLPRP